MNARHEGPAFVNVMSPCPRGCRTGGEWESFCRRVKDEGVLNRSFDEADGEQKKLSGRIYGIRLDADEYASGELSGDGSLVDELLSQSADGKIFQRMPHSCEYHCAASGTATPPRRYSAASAHFARYDRASSNQTSCSVPPRQKL